jgi:glutathionyl-hydroquinone reductase
MILRKLKGLEDMISMSVVNSFMGSEGWTFAAGPGVIADDINHVSRLHELYTKADPEFTGRVTVPVLWDKQNDTIVSNESSEILRMLNSAFDQIGALPGDFYPEALRAEIDELNEFIYPNINNGVYRAGFAGSQEAYDEAVVALFDALNQLEERLATPDGRHYYRSRLAPLYHAGALRPSVCRSLQVQHSPAGRLPEPVGLRKRSLPGTGYCHDRRHRLHQGALLRQSYPH